jgi:hypothetical protein
MPNFELLAHLDHSLEVCLPLFEALTAFTQIVEHSTHAQLLKHPRFIKLNNTFGLASLSLCGLLHLILFVLKFSLEFR